MQPPDLEILERDAARGIAGAQYNLGVWHLQAPMPDRDLGRAIDSFQAAIDQGFAPAMAALGYMHLRAQGVDYDAEKAAQLFDRAAEGGLPEARYRRGELQAAGCGMDLDLEAARRDFGIAAADGHPEAMGQLAYCMATGLGGETDPVTATDWYGRAALAGDPRAQCCIGWRYENGYTLPDDPRQALSWYLRAERAGYPGGGIAATRLSSMLSAKEIASAQAKSKERQPSLDATVLPASPAPGPSTTQVVSWSPRVFVLPDLVSQEECFHLIGVARPFLKDALVYDRQLGEQVAKDTRRAQNAGMLDPLRDIVVCNIEERLSRHAMLPAENAEPITIIHYGVGDEYLPHRDYYPPNQPTSKEGLALGGQRILTFLVYLNDVEEGGETEFVDVGISVPPKMGSGLVFFNCHPDGRPDEDTLHTGRPVIQGEKWLASRWFRESRYPYSTVGRDSQTGNRGR